jgi:hypothetical protein
MPVENPQELVEKDIGEGLANLFPDDEGIQRGEFRVAEGFEELPVLRTDDGEVAAVPWVWSARVRSAFGLRLDEDAPIEIAGVTLVSIDEEGETVFRRYVDWLGAYAQLGVGVFARPVIDDDEEFDAEGAS